MTLASTFLRVYPTKRVAAPIFSNMVSYFHVPSHDNNETVVVFVVVVFVVVVVVVVVVVIVVVVVVVVVFVVVFVLLAV